MNRKERREPADGRLSGTESGVPSKGIRLQNVSKNRLVFAGIGWIPQS